MKKVVITGADGYIGSHVVEELLKYPSWFSVVAASRSNQYLPSGVSFVPFDFNEDAKCENLYQRLGKPDICVHLAWRNGFKHNAVTHLEDFPNHFLFLKNLADHGTHQFAVAGSFREYGPVNGMVDESITVVPDNFYTLSKLMLKSALEIYFEKKDICLQWLRPFTVYGDDVRNQSILSKIIAWEQEGRCTFPFTDGSEEYDYIFVYELSRQIAAVIAQTEISGVIDCCSGKPTRLGERVDAFIKEHKFKIRPEYGAFPRREYDSPVIFGNTEKIDRILRASKLFGDDARE